MSILDTPHPLQDISEIKKKKSKKANRTERKKNIIRNKDYIEKYKKKNPCKCGENEPCCLSFHHKDGNIKEANISDLVTKGCSLKKIQEEIKKCEILCLNCHAKIHNIKPN